MLVLAVALALLIGVSLGLLGGGGSILTVPILRYVLGVDAHEAIALSLLVVGATSAAALVPHALAGRVRWRTGAVFGLAGMAGAFGAGRVARFIPEGVLLIAFGVMMLAAAFAMLRTGRTTRASQPPAQAFFVLAQEVPPLLGEPSPLLLGLPIAALGSLLTAFGRKLVRSLLARRAEPATLACSLHSQSAPKLGDTR